MKKTIRFFVSIFSTIIGLFSGLVSCNTEEDPSLYMGPAPSVRGKVLDKISGDGIQDIRVELLKNNTSLGTTSSSSNGSFGFQISNNDTLTNLTLRITDVDGTANGEYQGSTNTMYVSYYVNTNIKLDRK